MPWQTFPLVDEFYSKSRDACQSWQTFWDPCWDRVCPFLPRLGCARPAAVPAAVRCAVPGVLRLAPDDVS